MFGRDSEVIKNVVFCLCVSVVFTSCATHRDALDLKMKLDAYNSVTGSRLDNLEKSVAILDSLVNEQYKISLGIRAQMGSQTRELEDNNTSVSARQEEIYMMLKDLQGKLQTIQLYGGTDIPQPLGSQPQSDNTKSQSPSSGTIQGTKITVNPEDLYKSAIDDINSGNYPLAESRLLTFLLQFPENELAGNAQFWLGETAYIQGKYELAVKEYDKVLDKYSKSPKVPAAMLKKGFALTEIGDKKAAQTVLRKLTNSYPKSDEAKTARDKLKSLK